jgi:hypothetical protein
MLEDAPWILACQARGVAGGPPQRSPASQREGQSVGSSTSLLLILPARLGKNYPNNARKISLKLTSDPSLCAKS